VKLRLFIGSFLLLALASPAMAGNTWHVDGVNGSDSNNCMSPENACKTIQHAIKLAASGDSIVLAPAGYSGPIVIVPSVNIVGAGAGTTFISGGDGDAVVSVPAGSTVTISEVTIQGGENVEGYGGGVSNFGKLIINSSVIKANRTESGGGGVLNSGVLTINTSTISGNIAETQGGGIFCGGGIPFKVSMIINKSTISGNNGGGFGGGISAFGCPTTITDSTISNNTAVAEGVGGNGGGIWAKTALTINNSTIAGNKAFNGAGINLYPIGSTATFRNSIIANNIGDPGEANCGSYGPVTSDGYNLSSDDSCNFHSVGDLNNTDPKLGALKSNGGPTETMALLCMSPAINAGNPTGCTDGHGHLLHEDQRGDKRPGDPALTTGCDMGAYEVQFPK
jgi:hypothetical protein